MCCSRAAATWPRPSTACAFTANISNPTRKERSKKTACAYLVRYKDTEFFINIDEVQKPDLGKFLEIKSRTWSRKDANRKAATNDRIDRVFRGF